MNILIATFKAEIKILTIIALSKLNYAISEKGLVSYQGFNCEDIKEIELEELIHFFIGENGPGSGEKLLPFLKEIFSKTDYNRYLDIIRDTNADFYYGGNCPYKEDPAITADISWGLA
jgi:hypothetical protein